MCTAIKLYDLPLQATLASPLNPGSQAQWVPLQLELATEQLLSCVQSKAKMMINSKKEYENTGN